MKTPIPLIAFLLFAVINATAQTSCSNLVDPLYTDEQIIKPNTTSNPAVSYASLTKTRSDVSYLSDSLNGKACSAGNACANGNSNLTYEVYYPDIAYSETNKLPVFIFFHAGGFSDCSTRQSDDLYCIEFAKRGYVAFNIEYRRGRDEDPQNKFTSASHWLALYRAIQDGRGALRTIVSREISKSTTYRIDVKNIFLAGTSSGSDVALNIAYSTPAMVNQVFAGVSPVLGAITIDSYAGNAPTNTYTIKGILDMWGGVPVPLNYAAAPADFFLQNPKRPAIVAFHGAADKEVNINSKDKFFSNAPSVYNTANLCTAGKTFTLPNNGKSVSDFKLLGSQGLYDVLKTQMGMKFELYVDCDMEHGLSQGLSDFGLGDSVTNKDVQTYIVQRAATFFQNIMNTRPATLAHTRFVDCLNNRFGCNGDTADICSNTAICSSALNTSLKNDLIKKKPVQLFTVNQNNKTLTINLSTQHFATVRLLNINGAMLQTKKTTEKQLSLDCNYMPAGIYIVQVIQGAEIQSEKVILP
ncbi:hypothetical protein BH10BAC2_BH10BAC2_42900 [soil metagenome]